MTPSKKLLAMYYPATGDISEGSDQATNLEVACSVAAFNDIYLDYPRHTLLHSRCDFLQKLGRATRGQPQKGLRVLAPSGSGKSRAAQRYVEIASRHAPSDTKPVIYVQLEKFPTPRWLMTRILDVFGDRFGSRGTEAILRQRALACFERFGSELLILDEVQHLNYRSTAANDITDYLKVLLDSGAIPIVFMGTEEATGMFQRNVQLSSRLLPPCDFEPLNPRSPDDHLLLLGFVSALTRAIHEDGLMAERSDFCDPKTLSCLQAVSQGIVGRLSRLMMVALEGAVRRGARRVEVYDLALATERWAIPQGIILANPFLEGGVE